MRNTTGMVCVCVSLCLSDCLSLSLSLSLTHTHIKVHTQEYAVSYKLLLKGEKKVTKTQTNLSCRDQLTPRPPPSDP